MAFSPNSLPHTLLHLLRALSVLALIATAATLRVAAQPAPAARPNYPAPSLSVTVPFAAPVDFSNLQTTLKLLATVGGGSPHVFTVDTGSVGVVLPAREIPGFDPKAPGNTPGELRYSSSGLTLDGFWTSATVRFLNPGTGQPMAEATVQVLAVTAGSCHGGGPNAGHCTGAIPHMLGVGFGRGGDSANGMRTQAANPFVNLAAMNAGQAGVRMRHGFLITHAGITFGLTNPQTRGYQFVKLTPASTSPSSAIPSSLSSFHSEMKESASAPASRGGETSTSFNRDYQTAPGSFTLGALVYPMGVILIDTGLTNMIVEEPSEPNGPGHPQSGDLPAGEPVTVHLLGDLLRYHFTTGNENTPVAPIQASWAAYTQVPFVNTGLRALACFDYLYDGDNGYLGLRPTCAAK